MTRTDEICALVEHALRKSERAALRAAVEKLERESEDRLDAVTKAAIAIGLLTERAERAEAELHATFARAERESVKREKAEAERDALAKDAERYRWAAPILNGSDDKLADRRAIELAAALAAGLNGDAAIDDAMAKEPKHD